MERHDVDRRQRARGAAVRGRDRPRDARCRVPDRRGRRRWSRRRRARRARAGPGPRARSLPRSVEERRPAPRHVPTVRASAGAVPRRPDASGSDDRAGELLARSRRPGRPGTGEASRNASWSERSPSRSDRACWLPMSGAEAVTSAASAVMSLRASSRSRKSAPAPVGPSSASPHFTAAALIRWTAAVVMTSTAATSAMSRVAVVVGSVPGLVSLMRRSSHRPASGSGADSGLRVSSGNLGSRLTWVVLCRSRERPGARGPGAQVEFLPPGPRLFDALDAHRRQRPGSQSAPDGASRSRWREHGSRPCAPRGPRGLLL